MKLNFQININTRIEILELKDLKKLRQLMEVNDLGKPNFSQLGRELNCDRRTIKRNYEGCKAKERKPKKSKLDEYYETIKELLTSESKQIFYYKSHLYRYLVRERGLDCARNNFNHYILKHKEFAKYFKPKAKQNSIRSENPFGEQGQFDWKEKLKFEYTDGSKEVINIGSLVLSASRLKIWFIYPSTSQSYLFDFLCKAFETIDGVPKEILIDNASTMMDVARTEKTEGKVNVKFQQLADDFGFKIVPCVRARPQTKAKVENPMRIIDEILNYNGQVKDFIELSEKMSKITEEANSRICQATGLPPIIVFQKEKEHLLPLPHDKIRSFYRTETTKATINPNGLFKYKEKMYSVPSNLIGKRVTVHITENHLHVYYNTRLITIHEKVEKKVNYHPKDHLEMIKLTFKKKEGVEEFAKKHLMELERFNEQLSEFM